jgi:hypothetical protein
VLLKDVKLCTTNWDDLVLCKCSEKQSSTCVFRWLQELSQHLLLRRAQGDFITTDLEDHPKQSSEVWERKTKTHIEIVSISLQHQQHITNYVAEQTWVCTSIWTYWSPFLVKLICFDKKHHSSFLGHALYDTILTEKRFFSYGFLCWLQK